ncbi:HAD domain-containing protein [Longispora albida]|uniref:HAD domain-containing protein n=1 Tax=Longispora albida TaxID=203523 RepID=UPI001FE0F3A3|nr:HAD domain-containing protein [Longispora albida]
MQDFGDPDVTAAPGAFSVADRELCKTRLLSKKCSTCIFRPGNLMLLDDGRLKNLVAEALADESYIICHATLPYGEHPEVKPALCRGFYDQYSTNSLRIMGRLWGFVEVDPPGGQSPPAGDQTPERPADPMPRPRRGDAGRPVILVDVDGVLNPAVRSGAPGMAEAGFIEHTLRLTGPDGTTREGGVWINPLHGQWLCELAGTGAELVWATSWNHAAAEHLAPLLGLPDMPVVEVPADCAPRFGWSGKIGPIRDLIGDRPAAWLDDSYGGREFGWAAERDGTIAPTLLVRVDPHQGLTRADIDTVHDWLRQISY